MSPRIRDDLLRELERLPPEQLRRVVDFARTLGGPEPKGTPGAVLLKHFGVISPENAREMMAAIEEGCEQVDPRER